MKRRIAAILAISSIALVAHPQATRAQGAPPPTAKVLPNGMQGPNLSPAQQQKAIARKKKMAADVQALIKDKKLTNAQKQAKFIGMNKKFQADMLAILTPAQRTDLLRRKAVADARMKQMLDLRTKIIKSLTPDQKKQIGALQTSGMQSMQAVQNDPKLSNADKEAKMMAINHDQQSKMNAILTPTQRTEFEQLQAMYPTPPAGAGGPPPAPAH